MKKLVLFSMGVMALSATASYADSVKLDNIDTNDCARAQQEVSLLSSPTASVTTECMGPGYFEAKNGEIYSYRLVTTLTVAGALFPGMTVQLANIDTNDYDFAQNEVTLLNGPRAQVSTTVAGPSAFQANNGETYAYRLFTSVTIN